MYTKNVPNNPQPKLHGFEITLIQREIESMWNLELMKEIVRGQLLKSRLPRAGLIYEKFEGYLVHVFKNICFIEWKYVWVKKWVKIRIILFKNRKYMFKHIYQTVFLVFKRWCRKFTKELHSASFKEWVKWLTPCESHRMSQLYCAP